MDFNKIGRERPTWEAFSAENSLRNNLETERVQILEFQENVDAAREKISEGEITADELDKLDAELAAALPPSVRVQIPGFESAENAPELNSAFASPQIPITAPNASLGTPEKAAPKFDPMGS